MTEKTVLLQSVDPARTVAFTGYRPQKIMKSVNSRMTKVNQQYDYNTIYLIILKRLHVLIRTPICRRIRYFPIRHGRWIRYLWSTSCDGTTKRTPRITAHRCSCLS